MLDINGVEIKEGQNVVINGYDKQIHKVVSIKGVLHTDTDLENSIDNKEGYLAEISTAWDYEVVSHLI